MNEIIAVTPDTVQKHGFFCKMSARKTHAWQAKRDWLIARFDEGLELRLLGDKERGFVEFMPGDLAWRAVEDAGDLMLIHCLWVVGKSKGQGHARALLDEVERTARANGFNGLAVLASSGNWLVKPEVFAHFGCETVEEDGPFALMVKRFAPGPTPRLSGGWAEKAAACGPGLTVLRSAQCPYLEDAAAIVGKLADESGVPFTDVVIESAAELRARMPTPYGTYALVQDGRVVAYHYLLEKQLREVLDL
jgi:GNAT superfamily N-acetyltransferase